MIKSRSAKGKASVMFTVDPQVGAQTVAVCGEWNGWSPDADVMRSDGKGGFSLTVELDAGRAYRFRYLLDGHRWDNDWAADDYQPNDYGGDDSLVDLTALAEPLPPAVQKAPAARKAPAAQKAPAARKAPARKAPARKAPAAPKETAAPKEPAAAKAPAAARKAAVKKETAQASKKAAPAAKPPKSAKSAQPKA